MTSKEFFDKITDEILEECHTEDQYIDVYKRVQEYKETHEVSREDTKRYRETRAVEMLSMATQRYRKSLKVVNQ